MQEPSILDRINNNSYVVYFICTILKVILLYVLYKIFRYLRNKCTEHYFHNHHIHESKTNCCCSITNCLTFNFDKTHESKVTPALSLEDLSQVSVNQGNNPTEEQPLRRSKRLAQLKDK